MTIKGPIPSHILKRMNQADRPAGVPGMLPYELQSKADAKSEKVLQDQICGWLEIQGVFAGRQRMDKRSTLRLGWPDCVFCWIAGGETHPIAVGWIARSKLKTKSVPTTQNKSSLKAKKSIASYSQSWNIGVVERK